MNPFPPTSILRHRKENLKKCSLRGLESREDMSFYTYPWNCPKPDLSNYVVLAVDGKELSREDSDKGIFLVDGTWRYAEKMLPTLGDQIEKEACRKRLLHTLGSKRSKMDWLQLKLYISPTSF